MAKKPARIRGESPKAYRAFLDYLNMTGKRSLKRLVAEHRYIKNSVERWSADNGWQERVADYEGNVLADSIDKRTQTLDRIRQRLVDGADKAVDRMLELLDGQIPDKAVTFAQMNRDGKEVAKIPIVKPSTVMQQAVHILEFAGLIKPKRVELSGPDGTAIQYEAQDAIDNLSEEQLIALEAKLEAIGDG
jgi:hypothetical protein